MRMISWTVVIGSVSAILYGGIRPLVQDMRLPEVTAAQAVGTMAAKPALTSKGCKPAVVKAGEQHDADSKAASGNCDEPRLANQ